MSKDITIAVDDNGHSHHKLVWFKDGKFHSMKRQSIIGDGVEPITDTEGVPQDTYAVGGRRFCCNPQVKQPIDLRSEKYQTSDENKALMAHVLTEAGIGNDRLVMGLTLPWREYFLPDGKPNTVRRDQVAAHYASDDIINLSNDSVIRVERAKPYAEGLSAFYDWAIDDNGSLERANSTNGPVAVVDIGGSTTDITTIVGGQKLNLDHSRSDTKKLGVIDAKDKVLNGLSARLRESMGINPDVDGGIPDWMVQTAFEKGVVQFGSSEEIDVSDIVETSKHSVAEQIISFIKKTIGNPLGYQAIVFVGGGAIVYREALSKHYNHAFFLDEFANARGALKIILKLDRASLLAGLGD